MHPEFVAPLLQGDREVWRASAPDVLCVGMYRSGSTWQYNVACDLLELQGRGQRLGYIRGEGYQPKYVEWRRRSRIMKSHEAHRSFAPAIRGGQAVAIYCERDLRDVVFSLMDHGNFTFDDVVGAGGWLDLCLRNDRFWRATPGCLIQRYELIMNQPTESVRELAAFLKVPIKLDEARNIAEAHSPEKTLERINSLRDQLQNEGIDLNSPENSTWHDPLTLLNWNHIRTNRQTWHTLATPAQRKALVHSCGEWLIRQGYESDLSWATTDSVPDEGKIPTSGEQPTESKKQNSQTSEEL